eukprot:CAMPEP_0202967312 /NCGR_PEP_ID=MMETSP1396-20130829/12126_1 /ASSEMBLY_ACC=CAM_ASM_000872 /TAXON_ID= /ORGANISM="Pseudokeronopsis sp., Strain Brazil" /LENGTH=43 /DNA_ID= /DNA_START= /DNA_END= /DNA_ORIENTATION=
MPRKTAATNYWDNKTTELVIPEMEAEGAYEDSTTVIAEPPKME